MDTCHAQLSTIGVQQYVVNEDKYIIIFIAVCYLE